MKLKLWIIGLALLASASPSYAGGIMMMGGGVASAPTSNCMAGTYVAAFDGSYPSDSDAACTGAGAKLDGTVTGSVDSGTDYGEGGADIGIRLNAANEYISYPNTGPLFEPSGAYTVWMRVYVSANPAADMKLWSSEYNSTNYLTMIMKSGGDAYNIYRAGALLAHTWDDPISTGSWVTVGYSWDYTNQDHSGYSGGAWHDDVDELTSALAGTPTTFYFGAGDSIPSGGYVNITKWAIVSGYKADPPSGW